MKGKLARRKADLEEQLVDLWNWHNQQERYLDGWRINRNRSRSDRYLLELGKEFGPITVPHQHR